MVMKFSVARRAPRALDARGTRHLGFSNFSMPVFVSAPRQCLRDIPEVTTGCFTASTLPDAVVGSPRSGPGSGPGRFRGGAGSSALRHSPDGLARSSSRRSSKISAYRPRAKTGSAGPALLSRQKSLASLRLRDSLYIEGGVAGAATACPIKGSFMRRYVPTACAGCIRCCGCWRRQATGVRASHAMPPGVMG